MRKHRVVRRAAAVFLVFVMAFTTVFGNGITAQAAGAKQVKKVTVKIGGKNVTKKTYAIETGGTANLKVSVTPAKAKKSISFKSSKTDVVKVSKKGKINAVGEGTSKITITVVGKNKKKKSTYVKVKVNAKPQPATSAPQPATQAPVTQTPATQEPVIVEAESVTATIGMPAIEVGGSTAIMATVLPTDAVDKTTSFKTSDAEVATVSDLGVVKGVSVGTAVITVSTVNGKTTTVAVTVTPVEVKSVTVTAEEDTLKIGQKLELTAVVQPSNATDKTLTYTSSDVNVAKVNQSGVVTAVSVGTVDITVKAANGKQGVISIEVVPIEAESVKAKSEEASIQVGKTVKLEFTVLPEDTTDSSLTFSSSDDKIATVSETGEVTAVAVGTTEITAKTKNDKKTVVKITVTAAEPDSVTADGKMELKTGETKTLEATVLPEEAEDKSLTYASDNSEIVTVSEAGVVTAVAAGTAKITVTTKNGKTAIVEVTVSEIEADSVSVKAAEVTVGIGRTVQIEAGIQPENTANQTLQYVTGNDETAVVNEKGVVTGKAAGETEITVRSVNGKTAVVKVTVVPVEAESVAFAEEKLNVVLNRTASVSAAITPEDVTDKSVIYASENEEVATVDQEGTVKGISLGTVNITATTANGKSAAVEVTVVPVEAESVTAEVELADINAGAVTVIKPTVLPEDTADKSVAYTSSDDKIAVVNDQGVVTGIGQGQATITVTTKNGKTTTVDINVTNIAVTGVELNAEKAELFVNETTKLTATLVPENATLKTITWETSNATVADVAQDGTVTAKGEGTAEIKAIAASGVFKVCVVNVSKQIAQSDGISIEMINPYKDLSGKVYNNTILVGDNMTIQTRVVENGRPRGGVKVTLSKKALFGNCANAFDILGDDTVDTDADGYATFAFGLKKDYSYTAVEGKYQSYDLTVKESASNMESHLTVRFASVQVNGITVLNGDGVHPALVPSENADKSDTGIAETYYIDNTKTEEFVTSQQVSSDEDDHKVYLSATPCLLLPATKEKENRGDWFFDVPEDKQASGMCTIYNDDTNEQTTVRIDEIPAGLQYIKLQLDKLELSEFAMLNVDLYSMIDGERIGHEERNSLSNGSKIIQIELQKDVPAYMVVSLVTQGQVDTVSDGYILKRAEGVWKSENIEDRVIEEIQGSVTWINISEKVAGQTERRAWTYEEAAKYLPEDSPYLNTDYKYLYDIPGYPYTGNALIMVKNQQNEEIMNFLYPIKNNGSNKNILAEKVASKSAIPATNHELQDIAGELTQEGEIAIVDSQKTGFTALQAEVKVAGLDDNELNAQNGGLLYTSIQWAQVPKKDEEDDAPDYFAIEGQQVKVKAQLYDKNGNIATTGGKAVQVKLYYKDKAGEYQEINVEDSTTVIGQESLIVDVANRGEADNNGTVVYTLRDKVHEEEFSYIEGLSAEAKGYEVKLTLDDGTNYVDAADIYWVDLGMTFVDSANSEDDPVRTTQFSNTAKQVKKPSQFITDDTKGWNVGYQVVARSYKFQYDYLSDEEDEEGNLIEYPQIPEVETHHFVKVTGVNVDYTIDSDKVKKTQANNMATLISQTIGQAVLTGTMNIDMEASDKVAFTFYDDNGDKVTYQNVGTGAASITNTELNLTTIWTANGMKVELIAPNSVNVREDVTVYVKVADKWGNPLKNNKVVYQISGLNGTEGKVDAPNTDEKGISTIVLPAPENADVNLESNITVTVNDSITQNINLHYNGAQDNKFTLRPEKENLKCVKVGSDLKTLFVYFSRTVDPKSIRKGMFTFIQNEEIKYSVETAEPGEEGNCVKLTLDKAISNKASEHTLTIQTVTDLLGIKYALYDTTGQSLTEDGVTFVPGDNVSE